MTAKITADATGTKVTIGTAAEDALQIDATAKTISALAPYALEATPKPGQVLQTLFFTDAGGTLPAAIGNITQTTKNITPKSTNSTIKVTVSFYGAPVATGSFINAAIRQTLPVAAPVGAQISHGLTTVGVSQSVGMCVIEGLVSNSALTPRGFQLWANNATGVGGFISSMVWTITEVQN
jgi:hypothetical protein